MRSLPDAVLIRAFDLSSFTLLDSDHRLTMVRIRALGRARRMAKTCLRPPQTSAIQRLYTERTCTCDIAAIHRAETDTHNNAPQLYPHMRVARLSDPDPHPSSGRIIRKAHRHRPSLVICLHNHDGQFTRSKGALWRLRPISVGSLLTYTTLAPGLNRSAWPCESPGGAG